jgi:hypothetical protein
MPGYEKADLPFFKPTKRNRRVLMRKNRSKYRELKEKYGLSKNESG